MVSDLKTIHPPGEKISSPNGMENNPIEVATFDGKLRVEWDPDAAVTPIGQLPFFIQFLKVGD